MEKAKLYLAGKYDGADKFTASEVEFNDGRCFVIDEPTLIEDEVAYAMSLLKERTISPETLDKAVKDFKHLQFFTKESPVALAPR